MTRYRTIDYQSGWENRGASIRLWLDIFRRQGDLDDVMMLGLRIAEAALEATNEPEAAAPEKPKGAA